MATTPTPSWMSNRNGLTSDPSATMQAADLNQYLGTHAATVVYAGSPILTPNGTGGYPWFFVLGNSDISQPFTLSGTTVGRVSLPLLPVGSGADLLVSLCADSSGVPGTVLRQTRIPASWIYQQSAVSGIAQGSYSSPIIDYTGNPLAIGPNNWMWSANITQTNWPYPYTTSTAAPSATFYSNYMIQSGGVVSSAPIDNVFTIPYSVSGTSGILSQAIPQASYPTKFDGSGKMCVLLDSVTGGPVVVIAGGSTTFLGTPNTTVYTSSINTVTGALSAWSTQQALPGNLQNQATCGYNGFVYLCGGVTSPSGTSINQVLYAQVANGQITQWNTTTPLPIGLSLGYAIATNGFLFAIGGVNAASAAVSSVFYAAINANGSIGPWLTGPSLPAVQNNLNETAFANGNMIIINPDSPVIYGLGVTQSGPASEWSQGQGNGTVFNGALDNGDGSVSLFGLQFSDYNFNNAYLTPRISVPLPTSGLTNGTTYHVLIQQQGGDLNNYLRMHIDFGTFPGNPIGLSSSRGAFTWSNSFGNGSVPLEIYDKSTPGGYPGFPLHTWEDSGNRVTTILTTGTPDAAVIGLLESTMQPGEPLNQTWNFNNGLGQWGPVGGTIASSTAHVYQQLSASALLTPSGSASTSYLSTEAIPITLGHNYTGAVIVFSPTGYSACVCSVNWYTSANVLISTTSGTSTSVAANTWTRLFVSLPSTSIPSNAAFARLSGRETGTPPATALLYFATGALTDNLGAADPSVTQITYGNSWPNPVGPPTSIVQLA
jgi:hypothetical protein